MKPCWGSIRGVVGTMLLLSAVAFAHSPEAASAKPAATKESSTTKSKHTSHKGKKSRKSWRSGQQKVDPARAREIQEALIRQHYLEGEATGKWDSATEDAMRRFQAANGWQNKTVPDSRALIKLGLGPSHDHLLNPESAMTSAPSTSATTTPPAQTPAQSVDPGGSSPQRRP